MLERLKKLFERNKHQNSIVNISNLIKIPSRDYFQNDCDSLSKIDTFKEDYLNILRTNKTITINELDIDNLEKRIFLVIDIILNNFLALEDISLLASEELLIQTSKLKLYIEDIRNLEKELILRLIALKELKRSLHIKLKNRRVLDEKITSLGIKFQIFESQKVAILKEVNSYLDLISIKKETIIDNQFLDKRLSFLINLSSSIIDITLVNLLDNPLTKIAYLEKSLEEYAYQNKDLAKELSNKITANSLENKDIENSESQIIIFSDFGRNLISSEVLSKFYELKFKFLYRQVISLRLSPFIKEDYGYPYYLDLIQKEIQTLFQKEFIDKNLLSYIKEMLKNDLGFIDYDEVLLSIDKIFLIYFLNNSFLLSELDNSRVKENLFKTRKLIKVKEKCPLSSLFDFYCEEHIVLKNKDSWLSEGIVYFVSKKLKYGGLILPDNIDGDLSLSSLTSAEGLVLPENIGGSLYLGSLTNAEGLILPKNIGGSLVLEGLTSAEDLVLPENIGGGLYLGSLTNAEGLVLPKSIGGCLDLEGLTSAKCLILPESIGNSLYLRRLTSAKGLILPENIGGSLVLEGLTSAKGLVLSETIDGGLYLSGLTSAKDLVLPKSIGGSLYLGSLTNAEGLVFPENIGGYLDLKGLTSAEGLVLPKSIGGYLNLEGLNSAKCLVLPKSIGGSLYLNNLKNTEGLILPDNIGSVLILKSITFNEFLKLEIKDFLYQKTIYLADITIYSGELEKIINERKIKIKTKKKI